MCCGKYKEELFRQNTVNSALIKVHFKVKDAINDANNEKAKKKLNLDVKELAEKKLYKSLKEQEFVIKLRQSLILDPSNKVFWRKEPLKSSRQSSLKNKGTTQKLFI